MTERVKRYQPQYAIQFVYPHVTVIAEDDLNGEMVLYSDYTALLKSAEALAGALEALTEFERPLEMRNEGARYRWDEADAALKAHRELKEGK